MGVFKMQINDKILIVIITVLLILIAIIGTYTFATLNNDNKDTNNNQETLANISNTSKNSSPTIYTEKVYISSNTNFGDGSRKLTAVTTSENFVITMIQKYEYVDFDIEDPFTGYLTINPRNSDIKIISIEVKQGNGIDGFYWKAHSINSKGETTITLGENTLANVYQDGNWGQLTYIIKYEKT